uniref:Uncharacterized protein n=1 Tax=Avena sativa TaxID=4498 RepID=A0ACD5UMD6_AVESA
MPPWHTIIPKTSSHETIKRNDRNHPRPAYKYRPPFLAPPPPELLAQRRKRSEQELGTEKDLANEPVVEFEMSRVWVAATLAAVRAQRERAAVAGARDRMAGLAPQAAALGAARAAADDGWRQAGADESLRKAMYLSCWGPS